MKRWEGVCEEGWGLCEEGGACVRREGGLCEEGRGSV